jgi:hypothetical protein
MSDDEKLFTDGKAYERRMGRWSRVPQPTSSQRRPLEEKANQGMFRPRRGSNGPCVFHKPSHQ